jgi:preprotein translocase subunit SecG
VEGFVLAIHIVVCVLLVVIVLLQSGKSADLAGAFGGGGSQSTFGPRGAATFLSKMTTTLAVLFMVTSLTLWIIAAKKAGTILSKEDVKQEQTTGQTPGQPAGEKPGAAADTDKQTTETDKQTTETETEKKENNGSS